MKMRSMILVMAAVALAMSAFATPITNQTLACPTCVVDSGADFSEQLVNGSTALTGWTVGGTAIVWVREWNGTNGWQSADGLGSVVGLNTVVAGADTWGSVSQTILGLTPSTTYTLFYSLSAAPGGQLSAYTAGQGAYGYGSRWVNIQVGGEAPQNVQYSYYGDNSSADMNWEQHLYQFTTGPNDTEAILTFQSASTGIRFGAAIDDVYFQEGGVPEPGTLSLMIGAGLAGLAFLKFKK